MILQLLKTGKTYLLAHRYYPPIFILLWPLQSSKPSPPKHKCSKNSRNQATTRHHSAASKVVLVTPKKAWPVQALNVRETPLKWPKTCTGSLGHTLARPGFIARVFGFPVLSYHHYESQILVAKEMCYFHRLFPFTAWFLSTFWFDKIDFQVSFGFTRVSTNDDTFYDYGDAMMRKILKWNAISLQTFSILTCVISLNTKWQCCEFWIVVS